MSDPFLGSDFIEAVRLAGAKARLDTLKAGVPVFYADVETDVDVMEQPDGRRFEIRYIPGAPADRNYEIVREISKTAA